MRHPTVTLAIATLVCASTAVRVDAATCTSYTVRVVNTLIDENDGPDQGTGQSLREALAEAAAGDIVVFDDALAGGNLVLSLGELTIASALTVDGDTDGDGAADITLDGNDVTRILRLQAPDQRVRLQHLDFVNGAADEGGAILQEFGDLEVVRCGFFDNQATSSGGAIRKLARSSSRRLHVASSTFLRNVAVRGGAIYARPGVLLDDEVAIIIDGCRLQGNVGTEGGAVAHDGGFQDFQTMLIANCLFTTNASDSGGGRGGAVWIDSSSVRVDRCAFLVNGGFNPLTSQRTAFGGAMWIDGLGVGNLVEIENTRFQENLADQAGGAIYIRQFGDGNNAPSPLAPPTVRLRQVALVANSIENQSVVAQGGAIYVQEGGRTELLHCSVMNNFALGFGGLTDGFSVYREPSPRIALTFTHTMIGNNAPGNLSAAHVSFGFTSLGYNMFTETTVPDAIATDVLGGFNNSSLTPSNDFPEPNSDARNAGDPALVAGQGDVLLTETDGRQRVHEGRIDIGPYEIDAPLVPGPTVLSVTRLDPRTTDAPCVGFLVTFSESVDGVLAEDFVVATSGTLLGSVVDVVTLTDDTATVTVKTGTGTGTLRLDVRDDDSIVGRDTRVPLGGDGDDNGAFTSGEAYTVGPPSPAGDLNCDGSVSVGDINPFVLALTDPAGYAAMFPDCDPLNADCNDDGSVTVGDINCFVALVTGD